MEPDDLVGIIIKNYMSLSSNNIWLKSQDIKAPTGEDYLWCVVGIRNEQILGQKGFLDPDTDEDVQQSTIVATIDIDLASRGEDAKTRAPEMIMALESIPAKQLMDENKMGVYRTMDILDLSAIEGAGALHRFRASVIVYRTKEIRKSTEQIFDKFSMEVEENG